MTEEKDLRITKEIEWAGTKVTLKEIKMSEVIHLLPEEALEKVPGGKEQKEKTANLGETIQQLSDIVKLATGFDLAEIMVQPPSQIKILMIELEEVNAAFFWIAGCFGIDKISIKTILRGLIQKEIATLSLKASTS